MAKTIAFAGDDGATYEAIPYDGSYPGDAITINEDSGGQMDDLARFQKTDVSDSFDERGICQLYKDGAFDRFFIFDEQSFYLWTAQGGYNTFVWKKVTLVDQETEQTLTTGSGQLTLGNLDSGQVALPTFASPVYVIVDGGPYQDRKVYKSTQESISSGNVTFGITMGAGAVGTPYADIIIVQMKS